MSITMQYGSSGGNAGNNGLRLVSAGAITNPAGQTFAFEPSSLYLLALMEYQQDISYFISNELVLLNTPERYMHGVYAIRHVEFAVNGTIHFTITYNTNSTVKIVPDQSAQTPPRLVRYALYKLI